MRMKSMRFGPNTDYVVITNYIQISKQLAFIFLLFCSTCFISTLSFDGIIDILSCPARVSCKMGHRPLLERSPHNKSTNTRV